MGDLSKNFSRSEFKCGCGCNELPVIDYELINVVQECINHFAKKKKVTRLIANVNSGYRCKIWNAYIWGKRNADRITKGLPEEKPAFNSKHTEGIAMDFSVIGVDSEDIHKYLTDKYPDKYGIGKYPGRVHIDIRKEKARWVSRS